MGGKAIRGKSSLPSFLFPTNCTYEQKINWSTIALSHWRGLHFSNGRVQSI